MNAHLGALARLGGADRRGDKDRLDVSLGAVREFRNAELNVLWVAMSPRPEPETPLTRPGLVAGISLFF